MKKYIITFFITTLLLLTSCTRNETTPTDNVNETWSTNWTWEIDTSMSFFVTSKNPWSWANLGWIEWADKFCQTLAAEVGADNYEWRAYLSTQASTWTEAVNARDRIGEWPWYNAAWVLIANNLDELHSNNNINKETALNENGEIVKWRWDEPNLHDILTWSMPDWTASGATTDTTCNNWTSDWSWSAIVGHHDIMWLDESDAAKSWNSSHLSRGCSLEDLASTGGWWLLYCFATNTTSTTSE